MTNWVSPRSAIALLKKNAATWPRMKGIGLCLGIKKVCGQESHFVADAYNRNKRGFVRVETV